MMQQPAAPSGPTVGDTIWVTRSVAVPDGYAVRPNGWTLTGAVELLGQPSVERVGDSTMVRYPVVAWDPGRHTIVVPGPILIAPSGAEDTLPPRSITLAVNSVLPTGVPDSSIQIQPGVGVVSRGESSPWPLGVALMLATVLVVLLRWWWGRPGRTAKALTPPVSPAVAPLESWHLAGEDRAVVAYAAAGLRDEIARGCVAAPAAMPARRLLAVLAHERPKWPLADLERLLAELDAARFSSGGSDAVGLARRADELRGRLTGPAS
jgi:hypothetical protein